MNNKLNALTFGYTGAIFASLMMLILGVLGNMGVYTNAVNAMAQWHPFFSLSIGGIIAGIIEAAISSFIGLYVFAWIYNSILPKHSM